MRLSPTILLSAAIACGQASSPSTSSETAASAYAEPTANASSELSAMNIRVPNAKAALRNLAQRKDELVTVVLKLEAEPVAVVRSEAPDLRISETTEAEIVDSLSQRQNSL